MKLKQIISVFALISVIVAAPVPFEPAEDYDSVTAGRAYSQGFNTLWDHYDFYGDFAVDHDGVQRCFSGRMNLHGQITKYTVSVDGVEHLIVGEGEEPLPGLPYPTEGTMTDFWISVRIGPGEDYYGYDRVAFGHTFRDRVCQNEAILVTLTPSYIEGFFAFNGESYPSESLRLVNSEGSGIGWYNQHIKGFQYYLDPMVGAVQAYVLSGHQRIGSLVLRPFDGAETQRENPVNINLAGQVVRTVWNGQGYYQGEHVADGQTVVHGQMVPAKVFLLDTEGKARSAYCSNSSGEGLTVSIYNLNDGRFDLLDSYPLEKVGYDNFYTVNFIIPKGYRKIMVVVTDEREDRSTPFNIFIHEYGKPVG